MNSKDSADCEFSLRLSKCLGFAVFCASMVYCLPELIISYLAVGLHEGAHALMCIWLKCYPRGLYVGLFGMGLKINTPSSFKNKLLIYSGGPAVSFILFFACIFIKKLFLINSSYMDFFIFANLSVGIINLIPMAPLDGASILKAYLTKHLGIIKGSKVLCKVSAFFYGFFIFICVCFNLFGVLNPGLIIFVSFTIGGIIRERINIINEKKLVFSGQISSGKRIKLISCDASDELLLLAGFIGYDYTVIFTVFSCGRFVGVMSQREIIRAITRWGPLCPAGECIKWHNMENVLKPNGD